MTNILCSCFKDVYLYCFKFLFQQHSNLDIRTSSYISKLFLSAASKFLVRKSKSCRSKRKRRVDQEQDSYRTRSWNQATQFCFYKLTMHTWGKYHEIWNIIYFFQAIKRHSNEGQITEFEQLQLISRVQWARRQWQTNRLPAFTCLLIFNELRDFLNTIIHLKILS